MPARTMAREREVPLSSLHRTFSFCHSLYTASSSALNVSSPAPLVDACAYQSVRDVTTRMGWRMCV